MSVSLTPSHFFALEQFAHADLFKECTYVWEVLTKLSSYLKNQHLGKIEVDLPSSVYLVNPSLISIGTGTTVEPGAYIQGPCIIGNNCQIRHGAYIRGDVITGDACVIGHDTEIKHSILLNHSSAAHFNYVGDSILGNRTNLGAGVKCANFKLDHAPVVVYFEGSRYETGLKKMGAIIGDGAQLGCNSVTSPGTLVGRNAIVYPCVHVQRSIPEGARIKNIMQKDQTVTNGVES